ncbi:uncharacterized protein [Chelonus insularis]|uniref:uncharacterized protein n=1 Tax=Chelonus insularis TaxID=460826 RepID=UPI00158A262D|nr:uncharacterized protein LOC118067717 [Chelonus insularis]
MSVSDPLIKDLKGWIRKLTEAKTVIKDDNSDLRFFCECLEKCLRKGILLRMNSIQFFKIFEVWHWMKDIADKHIKFLYTFTLAVENVSQNQKVQTSTGKLRLLIRTCLTKKCLHTPVELLVRTPGMALDYYEPNSILGDEILGEIFLSALLQISKLQFNLNLRNARFLDESWQLPECHFMELVPCKSLGVSVCFTNGKALVVNVQENSVAAEDDKVEIGDVLDEINREVLTSNNRGNLGRIIKKSSGLPVDLYVIKGRFKQSGDFYGPIISLIKQSGIERAQKVLKSPKNTTDKVLEKSEEVNRSADTDPNIGYQVTYCGSISTGTEGDVKQIEPAIRKLLKTDDIKSIHVRFECLEIGVKVTQKSNEEVLLNQSYMEISSCGRTGNFPDYYAFIAGDNNCNVATNFTAFIFHHRNDYETQTILQSLAQGFHRTHYAV